MTSSAIRSQGTTIAYLNTAVSPQVYVSVANIISFPTPSPEAPDIPVSNLSSTAAEFLVGLVDNGEITLAGHYNPNEASHSTLRAAAGTTTIYAFKITLDDVSPQQEITFNARVRAFRVNVGVDEPVNMEIVLRTTGAASWS